MSKLPGAPSSQPAQPESEQGSALAQLKLKLVSGPASGRLDAVAYVDGARSATYTITYEESGVIVIELDIDGPNGIEKESFRLNASTGRTIATTTHEPSNGSRRCLSAIYHAIGLPPSYWEPEIGDGNLKAMGARLLGVVASKRP